MSEIEDKKILELSQWELLEQQQREVRFHEAGHVVCFRELGFQVTGVTTDYSVIEREDAGGHTYPDRRSMRFLERYMIQPHNRERVENLAIGICAGIIAQSKVCGKTMDELRAYEGKKDYEQLNDLASRLALSTNEGKKFDHERVAERMELLMTAQKPESIAAKIAEWEAKAAAMMSDPRILAAVEAVADALDGDYSQLDRKQLDECINAAMAVHDSDK